MGSEESAGEEVGDEDVEVDVCGVTKLDKIRNEIIMVTTKVGEISKKVQQSYTVKLVRTCHEKG